MSSIPDMFRDVGEFHEHVLNVYPTKIPALMSLEFCVERSRFLAEELDEFATAVGEANIVGVSDALADLIYIALGTAYQMGLPFDDIWKAVHSANMRKERGITKRGNKIDAIKPAGWVGPEAEIARLIQRKL